VDFYAFRGTKKVGTLNAQAGRGGEAGQYAASAGEAQNLAVYGRNRTGQGVIFWKKRSSKVLGWEFELYGHGLGIKKKQVRIKAREEREQMARRGLPPKMSDP